MAETIRKHKNTNGFILPSSPGSVNFEAKIFLFADDTQIYCKNGKSIQNTFDILETYAKASGAKINYEKTKVIYIGTWKNKEPFFKKIKWVDHVIAVGVEFGYNINYEEIWLQKFSKFKNNILAWKKRDLSIFGKKNIIKFLITCTGFPLFLPDKNQALVISGE